MDLFCFRENSFNHLYVMISLVFRVFEITNKKIIFSESKIFITEGITISDLSSVKRRGEVRLNVRSFK